MITAAILIGLPILIGFMLTMDDPAAKPREQDVPLAATANNVIAFPAPAAESTPTGAPTGQASGTVSDMGDRNLEETA